MTPGQEHRRIRDRLVALAAAHGYSTEIIACGHCLSPRRVREIVAEEKFPPQTECSLFVEIKGRTKRRKGKKGRNSAARRTL